ncbi:MAG: hypothetical protein ACTHJU_03750 [Sphingopyxis sp.]
MTNKALEKLSIRHFACCGDTMVAPAIDVGVDPLVTGALPSLHIVVIEELVGGTEFGSYFAAAGAAPKSAMATMDMVTRCAKPNRFVIPYPRVICAR